MDAQPCDRLCFRSESCERRHCCLSLARNVPNGLPEKRTACTLNRLDALSTRLCLTQCSAWQGTVGGNTCNANRSTEAAVRSGLDCMGRQGSRSPTRTRCGTDSHGTPRAPHRIVDVHGMVAQDAHPQAVAEASAAAGQASLGGRAVSRPRRCVRGRLLPCVPMQRTSQTLPVIEQLDDTMLLPELHCPTCCAASAVARLESRAVSRGILQPPRHSLPHVSCLCPALRGFAADITRLLQVALEGPA